MRVFHFVTVKRKRALRPNSFFFFFNDSHIFLKCFNSNHNLSSYSLFSKCFLWFFYLSVHRGTGVFWWCFFICLFSLLLSRVTRFRVRLALPSIRPKNAEKLRLFCACSIRLLFSFFHVNWCSTDCKYLLIVLRMFIHSLFLL